MALIRDLYEEVKGIFPETTTRQFSNYCGMSDGYYGSVMAQKLPISTNALIVLAEVLEHKREISCACDPVLSARIDAVQQRIVDEVVARTQQVDSNVTRVRRMLLKAFAAAITRRDPRSDAMPFIMS